MRLADRQSTETLAYTCGLPMPSQAQCPPPRRLPILFRTHQVVPRPRCKQFRCGALAHNSLLAPPREPSCSAASTEWLSMQAMTHQFRARTQQSVPDLALAYTRRPCAFRYLTTVFQVPTNMAAHEILHKSDPCPTTS